ncbi:MAG: hypothetical protein KC940_23725, partial [Candidatus Omnitrophica bacterium]|nr:hypothetical protein [Candidatus Omnitrophota bacterium]
MDVEPNYFLLSGIILLAMVGPFTSLWISISGAIGLISWGLFSGRKDLESLKTFKERIREMLGLAFNYPVNRPEAPGVWVPKHSTPIRRVAMLGSVFVTTLFFAVAFYACLPWDFPPLQSTFSETFRQNIYGSWITSDSSKALEPHIGPFPREYVPPVPKEELRAAASKAPGSKASKYKAAMKRIDAEEAASEAAILAYGDRFLETFPLGWFLVSLAGFSEHPLKFGLSWFWSVIFTFAFVPAFLLSLIREPFERLLAFHPDLSVLQRSTASEPVWEKYERKLRHSEHEAPDPNDTSLVIREADHLLLGFDPWTDYPILLHRPLIDDSHVYIGGGTGSGKTTRAMVSLFTPLIRQRTDRKGKIEQMP